MEGQPLPVSTAQDIRNMYLNKQGISIPRTTGQQYAMGTSVAKSDLKTGDIVFFNTSGSGVSHDGIYIGSGQIHPLFYQARVS